MPGNEVEDGICNLFELDNSSQGQNLSHGIDGNWTALNDNQWAGKQRKSVVPLNLNLQNYSILQLDSLIGGGGGESISAQYKPNYAKLTKRNYQLNANGSVLGNHSFQKMQNQTRFFCEYTGYDQHNLSLRGLSSLKSQQEYESGTDSPTLTTNSERSEITEVSTDFNLLRGQQQLASGHQLGIPQLGLMQQSGCSDMQLLQQHMMFKQLQELQRQQQLQQLGDVRQQNSINQLSAMSKQAAGIQFSPLNGTPINDASQMFMNWVPCGASSAGQGGTNGLMFSPENGQPLCSMGLVPQLQPDVSLYGTPVANERGNMGQYPQVQGIPQAQKPVMHSFGHGNPFLRDQFAVSPDQAFLPQGAFVSSQGMMGKNMFGEVPNQGFNSGILSGNLQQGNLPQTNASMKELSGRQEQTGWPSVQQKTTQHGPSQGLVALDPVEEKILYNMDDTIWDASFGRRPDMGTAGFSNALESTDLASSLPSIQSGSWSALMQSAVAEASSSDIGHQEEWSGLTFQNTEQSTDNQLSNFMESDNQQIGWVDNNLQSTSSFSSKPLQMVNDSSMSPSFPGFLQPGIQFPVEQREGLCQDGSQESVEKSSKFAGQWIDCNPQHKSSIGGSQQVQSFMHSNNTWSGQIYGLSENEAHKQKTASHSEDSPINFPAVPHAAMAHQATCQEVAESNQSEYMGHADISVNKEKERIGKSPQQIGNGPDLYKNSYVGEQGAYEKQKNYYQSENSNGSYNSKGLSGSEQGYSGQFQFFGNASINSTNLEQGHLPHFRGNSRTSEEAPCGDDLTSVGNDGSNAVAQASQNMLELLHKVDQSNNDGSITTFGSADSNALTRVPKVEIDKSVSQLYNQPSTSQGFGLRLGPPSQQLPNSSHFLSPQGLPRSVSYPKSRHVNSELGEKNQMWLASSPSVQTLPPSHELSQRAHWDDKNNALGETGTAYLNIQGNSAAAYMPSSTYTRNQPHMLRAVAPVASQSSQAMLPSSGGIYPLFSVAASQDTSQHTGTNHLGQQFPVLEAVPVSQPLVMSVMSQPGDLSERPHNVVTNVPIQRQPSVPELLKVSSIFPSAIDPSKNSTINAIKGGQGSTEFGSGSQQRISSDILDASRTAGLSHGPNASSKHNLGSNAFPSGPLTAYSHQMDFDRVRNDDNHAHAAMGRNLVSIGHSLDSSPNLHQNYSLLDQIRAMKNVEIDPSKGNSEGLHDSFPSRETKTMSFLTDTVDDPRARALSQSALGDQPSSEMVKLGQDNYQNQSGSSNVVSNLMEQGQVSPDMAPSWLKPLGMLKNGRMVPMFDGRLAKVATGQFSFGKPSQNLHIHASMKQVDAADVNQVTNVMPNTVAMLVGPEGISAPYILPSDITNQSMAITRPQKRKHVTPESLPWHREMTKRSQRLQNMSMADQDWAQATNRLVEKVEDEVEMAEDLQPLLRSRRRLILTAQLMQQLLRPAPKSILSANAISHHDSVLYFISRLALGDACSDNCCARNDLLVTTDNGNMTYEKLKTIEGTGDQQLSEVIEMFSARAQKLENDFQRVDKTASIVDIRVECQELERFAVINRFAKFHIRGQADTSGTPKPSPQRYVAALPMPRKLPEGLQCISL